MLNSPFRERSYFAIQEIARNYFRVRQYEKAEQYLKKAMDSLPDIPTEAKHEIQSDLTVLYSEIGKQEEADRLITELKVTTFSHYTNKMCFNKMCSFVPLRLLSLNLAISRPRRLWSRITDTTSSLQLRVNQSITFVVLRSLINFALELPEDHLPPDAVIEASFDAIPNKSEAFTFRHVSFTFLWSDCS